MSLLIVELHEKHPLEIIPGSDYEVVHADLRAIDFGNTAFQNAQERRLTRATYFSSSNSSHEVVTRLWEGLERKLGRKVSLVYSDNSGQAFAFGLKPTQPAYRALSSLASVKPLQTIPAPYTPANTLGGLVALSLMPYTARK